MKNCIFSHTTSTFVTKETFVVIAADSMAVDEVTKLTDVGYNFDQVEISSFTTSC